ncbi:MAG TPA: hypothetical protein VIM96_04740 [Pseudomonadales bacterium]
MTHNSDTSKKETTRIISILFSAIFMLLISCPFIIGLLKNDLQESSENRTLEQWDDVFNDELTLENTFLRIDKYWNDQHGLRQQLNNGYSAFRYKIGIVSSSDPTWHYGKDGWLFEHQKENDLSEEDLNAWKKYFDYRGRTARELGIEYIVLFAPKKSSIYPEKFNKPEPPKNAASQLYDYLSTASHENILDIRSALISKKDTDQIYHKLDIHWNAHGANYAHVELMSRVSEILDDNFYKARVYDQSWFTLEDAKEIGLAKAFNLQDYLHERQPWFADASRFCTRLLASPLDENAAPLDFSSRVININSFKTHCPAGKGRALMFVDSFSNLLWVFVSEYFQEVTYISGGKIPKTDSDLKVLLEKYRPDILIEEIAEKHASKTPQ